MRLSTEDHQDFARQLFNAENTRTWIDPLTAVYDGVGVEDAYAIAREVQALKLAAGETLMGRKIGITSAPMRELAGSDEPDFGNLYSGWLVPAGGSISRGSLNAPSAEIEIAFVMGADLSGESVTAADVARATALVHPSIEIVDSRYRRRGPGPLVIDNVADAAWCGGFVVGDEARRLDEIDVSAVRGRLLIDGDVVAEGSSVEVMGDPLEAVAWLARKLHSLGDGLAAGDVVLSGSFIRAMPIDAGQTITAVFEDWADLNIKVTA